MMLMKFQAILMMFSMAERLVQEQMQTYSFSPLLSTLADTDPTTVAGRGVVAGSLPHFKSDTTTAATLAP